MNDKIQNKSSKKIKQKKIIVGITVLLILFLAVNTYASTQGYNIFFVIKNLFTNDVQVNNRDEILTDREVIISYQYIKIDDNTRMQVNKLITKENETKISVLIDTLNAEKAPKNFIVSDITDGREIVIGNQKAKGELEGVYTENIELIGMKENTQVLKIEVQDGSYKNMITLEVDLNEKEINITNGQRIELERISEVELKEVLSKYALLNFWKDMPEMAEYHNKKEYDNELKIMVAEQLILGVDKTKPITAKDIHAVIKEMTGEQINKPLILANKMRVYHKEEEMYGAITGDEEIIKPLCLQIADIIFDNGIYSVTFTYCKPTEEAYNNGKIEELDRYETTMKFTINEDYTYTKYCLVDIDNITSELIKNENTDNEVEEEIVDKENESENTVSNNIVSDLSNTVSDNIGNNSNNTVLSDNTVSNNTVNNSSNTSEKIDNYASTMNWSSLYTPGMRTQMPGGWNKEVICNMFNGKNGGDIATIVTGDANGIDKQTNEIIYSNMTITYYLPEFVEYQNTEDYAKAHAESIGTYYGGTGYGTSMDSGIVWAEVISKRATEDDRSEVADYCHIEKLADGSSIAYRVRVESSNAYRNYKITNIKNWIIPKIAFGSF